jgi:HPt (histidine-containing phosphotransfer) domain-containing protein
MPGAIDPNLKDLWVQFQGIIFQRLQAICTAAQAAAQGSLDDATRLTALRDAHRLAGSLGTFGLPEGTRVAREIESLLEQGAEASGLDAPRLTALAAELAGELEPHRVLGS